MAVRPRIDPELGPDSVSANYSSPRGVIAIHWVRSALEQTVDLYVTIPVGVEGAEISVPTPFGGAGGVVITESGSVVWDGGDGGMASLEGSRGKRQQDDHAVLFAVGSGRYVFKATPRNTRLVDT